MRPEDKVMTPKPYADCQPARERSCQVLRNKARRMHEEAVKLEQLADWAVGLNDAQDEALWSLVISTR